MELAGQTGKTEGPNGERVDISGPINDLDRIVWTARKVYIVFDTNVHTNESVRAARRGLCWELTKRGAKVDIVSLPENCGVNGIDDLLGIWGPDRVLDLFAGSTPAGRLDVRLPPQFDQKPEGMFRTNGAGQLSQSQLTNYSAKITANIVTDDGLETTREFEIEAEQMGRQFRFTIPASEFARMDWPIQWMGARAITYPGQRDYTRTAIQSLSLDAEERCIYTHTGWRKVEGGWLYLDGSGAVGATGLVSGINVRLPASLGRYELRLPTDSDTLASAIRASLGVIELGPPEVTFPMLAATYRAVLGETDFAVHLVGETGAFKSEAAALCQQHFGASLNRQNLPGSWSSTGNALEASAFHAKDSLYVIDDFAPQGSGTEVTRLHGVAERVFRAAGNHTGRGRMDSRTNLRMTKPPRALIFSTGEDVPRGQSVRARLFIVEFSKNSIAATSLSRCQNDASSGLYALAMGGYIQWLARDYDKIRARFSEKASQYRQQALSNAAHARTPDILANLQAGFELFLEFSLESGVINRAERDALARCCWDALRSAAATQFKHQASTEPAVRFLELVRSSLASGRAHLAARVGGGAPDQTPRGWGWRHEPPRWVSQGELIGWVDGDDVYLEPTAAYRVAQLAARDMGDDLGVSEKTLRKRLSERNFLASTALKTRGTFTIRRTIADSQKEVLHLLRNTVLPEASDSDEDVE